jgi:hypothetical protein
VKDISGKNSGTEIKECPPNPHQAKIHRGFSWLLIPNGFQTSKAYWLWAKKEAVSFSRNLSRRVERQNVKGSF